MYNQGASTSQYQGYPYTNPPVVDAPTVDAATAARYANLPRKPFTTRPEKPKEANEKWPDRVFVDIPCASTQSTVSEPSTSHHVADTSVEKVDPEDNPRVFIELPLSTGSDVADRRIVEDDNQTFVQETIFYDPFKDRRIEVDRSESEDSSAHSSIKSDGRTRPGLRPGRPSPPNTLDFGPPRVQPPTSQSIFSKEALVYGNYPTDNGFSPSSQIPIRDFPEPPPAYTEVASIPSPQPQVTTPGNLSHGIPSSGNPTPGNPSPGNPSLGNPSPGNPSPGNPSPDNPRTQVIVANANSGTEDSKLFCSNCNQRTHCVVTRRNGFITHLMAILFLFIGLIPITIAIYCMPCGKYRNYHCSFCNRLIAYRVPCACHDLKFTK